MLYEDCGRLYGLPGPKSIVGRGSEAPAGTKE
jgi:hypothetical protein